MTTTTTTTTTTISISLSSTGLSRVLVLLGPRPAGPYSIVLQSCGIFVFCVWPYLLSPRLSSTGLSRGRDLPISAKFCRRQIQSTGLSRVLGSYSDYGPPLFNRVVDTVVIIIIIIIIISISISIILPY